MNRGFGMITALLVLTIAFCVSGTVMSKESRDCAQENERYAALEDEFRVRVRAVLENEGYRDSGVTITWTREGGGERSYLVEIHHRGIDRLDEEGRERLSENLRKGAFGGETLIISYI